MKNYFVTSTRPHTSTAFTFQLYVLLQAKLRFVEDDSCLFAVILDENETMHHNKMNRLLTFDRYVYILERGKKKGFEFLMNISIRKRQEEV